MTADRLAIVGTDTGVGKTVLSAAIARAMDDLGVDVQVVKPAQTGYPPDDDAAIVAETCDDPAVARCLRYLEPPLAPRVAAAETGTTLDYDSLREQIDQAFRGTTVGLVEGVGGLRVPLTAEAEIVDLVRDLGCRALIVARSRLGTLNHTALTVEALERRGVPVTAVVCNRYTGDSLAERTNPAALRRQLAAPVVTIDDVGASEPTAVARAITTQLLTDGTLETVYGRELPTGT